MRNKGVEVLTRRGARDAGGKREQRPRRAPPIHLPAPVCNNVANRSITGRISSGHCRPGRGTSPRRSTTRDANEMRVTGEHCETSALSARRRLTHPLLLTRNAPFNNDVRLSLPSKFVFLLSLLNDYSYEQFYPLCAFKIILIFPFYEYWCTFLKWINNKLICKIIPSSLLSGLLRIVVLHRL